MGLIQRVIEQHGISTVGVSIVRQYTENVKPPRTVFLRWPFGHPFGEPFNTNQQLTVVLEMLIALYEIKNPADIVDLPYRWRKVKDYSGVVKERKERLKQLLQSN